MLLKIIIVIIATLLFIGYAYEQFDLTFGEQDDQEGQATFCPKDRFQCPNGVYVERTGPDCAFICPEF